VKANNRKTIEGLKSFMVKNGYTGLYQPDSECGCNLEDLQPCGEDWSECHYGYEIPSNNPEFDFLISSKKP